MTQTDVFIEKAKQVHGSTYGYHHVSYVNSRSKVILHCYQHGPFSQTPNNHLRGQGCPVCANHRKVSRNKSTALSTQQFIDRANVRHAHKYTYNNTAYVASNKPIVVTCPTHGDFVIGRAEKHLYGQGCPTCGRVGSLAEEVIKTWLSHKGVLFYCQHTFDDCVSPYTNRKLVFDFYVPTHNLLIEYDGEHHYKKSPLFHTGDKFERLTEYDKIKTSYANSRDLSMVRIKHTEIKNLSTVLETLFSGSS